MTELPKLKWFRVRDEAALRRVPSFIKSLHRVNTFNGPRPDRKGDFIITLGWDDRPDSDWGRFKGNSAALWFANEQLAEKGEKLVCKALGFAVEEQSA